MGERQQQSSFYRPADVLAAFSRASQAAEQPSSHGTSLKTSIPQATRSALDAALKIGAHAVRCRAHAGRDGLIGLCRRVAGSRIAPDGVSAHDPAGDARQASRESGGCERARLLSHFTIPDQEDGSATA